MNMGKDYSLKLSNYVKNGNTEVLISDPRETEMKSLSSMKVNISTTPKLYSEELLESINKLNTFSTESIMKNLTSMRINIPSIPKLFSKELLESINKLNALPTESIMKNLSSMKINIPPIPKLYSEELLESINKLNTLPTKTIMKSLSSMKVNISVIPKLYSEQLLKSINILNNLPIEVIKKSSLQLNGLNKRLAEAIEFGIPDSFIKKFTELLKTYEVNNFDIDAEILEAEYSEVAEELINNPSEVWNVLNKWAKKILNTPSNLKNTQPFIFLTFHILALIFSFVLLPAIQDQIKNKVIHELNFESNNINTNTQNIKTDLYKEYEIAENYINKIRITTKKLPVYQSNTRSSNRIDWVKANNPVIIIEKKKNWSLIIYKNNNQEEVNGWVYTRYLLK